MQKIGLTLAVMVAAWAMSSCGSADKYADVKEIVNKVVVANEKFASSMEAANDAASVAQAINDFAAASGPSMKAFMGMRDKYPELSKKDGEIPADLKESLARLTGNQERISAAMKKIGDFSSDAAVADAQKKLRDSFR